MFCSIFEIKEANQAIAFGYLGEEILGGHVGGDAGGGEKSDATGGGDDSRGKFGKDGVEVDIAAAGQGILFAFAAVGEE